MERRSDDGLSRASLSFQKEFMLKPLKTGKRCFINIINIILYLKNVCTWVAGRYANKERMHIKDPLLSNLIPHLSA